MTDQQKMARRLHTLARSGAALRRPLPTREIAMHSSQHPLRRGDVAVFVDFDQTITTRDTIGLLFDAARATRPDEQLRAAHAQQVGELVEKFMRENNALSATKLFAPLSPAAADRFDEKGLHDYLEAFVEVDLRSIHRVIASKTLSLMSRNDLEAVTDRVEAVDGCVEALSIPSRVWVLSANWSRTMIQAKLRQVGLRHANVVANELKMDAEGLTTGDIDLVMQAPSDKAAFVAKFTSKDERAISLYIGDSTNDLLAMLQADVGVTLGFAVDSSFVRVCLQYGVNLVPLSAYTSIESCSQSVIRFKQSGRRVIFTATSWQEIQTILTP